jgi:hypothetical protein
MRENEHNIGVEQIASVFIWFNLDDYRRLESTVRYCFGKVPVPYRTVQYGTVPYSTVPYRSNA